MKEETSVTTNQYDQITVSRINITDTMLAIRVLFENYCEKKIKLRTNVIYGSRESILQSTEELTLGEVKSEKYSINMT